MAWIDRGEVSRSLRGFTLGLALGTVLAILTRNRSQPTA
jgi:hypothetical protein